MSILWFWWNGKKCFKSIHIYINLIIVRTSNISLVLPIPSKCLVLTLNATRARSLQPEDFCLCHEILLDEILPAFVPKLSTLTVELFLPLKYRTCWGRSWQRSRRWVVCPTYVTRRGVVMRLLGGSQHLVLRYLMNTVSYSRALEWGSWWGSCVRGALSTSHTCT